MVQGLQLFFFIIFISLSHYQAYNIKPLIFKTNSVKRTSPLVGRNRRIYGATILRDSLLLSEQAIKIFGSVLKKDWYVWCFLSTASTIGIIAENSRIGSIISSPLITMAITLVGCNLGLLPTSSSCYKTVLNKFVPLSIPLLLFDADLRKCFKQTGDLLTAFVVGSVGSIVGSIAALYLIPMKSIQNPVNIASAICARHIGGAVNFVAVADALNIPSDVVAAALAADNLIVVLYFIFLFSIAHVEKSDFLDASDPKLHELNSESNVTIAENILGEAQGNTSPPKPRSRPVINLTTISKSVTLSLLICFLASILSELSSFSLLTISSTLTVISATLFPATFGSLAPASGIIGVLLVQVGDIYMHAKLTMLELNRTISFHYYLHTLQLFFAVTGASGHIPSVARVAPSLLLHSLLQVTCHWLFTYLVGTYLFRIPIHKLALASNANVGGPTTAAGMAKSKRWNDLVLPSLLTGVFGYAIATFVGLTLSVVLRR